jgi:DNA-binding response OmpR family regulator
MLMLRCAFGAVISEADDRQEVFRCLKLGAADYLVKPLRLQELRNIWTRVWWHQVRGGDAHGPGYL